MLRLIDTHPAAAVERALTAALERHSPRLETVWLILRQQQAGPRRCARRSQRCVRSCRGSVSPCAPASSVLPLVLGAIARCPYRYHRRHAETHRR